MHLQYTLMHALGDSTVDCRESHRKEEEEENREKCMHDANGNVNGNNDANDIIRIICFSHDHIRVLCV